MGKLYARDDEDDESARGASRLMFDGEEDDYAEWAFRMDAYLYELGGRVWERANGKRPGKLPSLDEDYELSKSTHSAAQWSALGATEEARKAALMQTVKDGRKERKKAIAKYDRAQRKVFN